MSSTLFKSSEGVMMVKGAALRVSVSSAMTSSMSPVSEAEHGAPQRRHSTWRCSRERNSSAHQCGRMSGGDSERVPLLGVKAWRRRNTL